MEGRGGEVRGVGGLSAREREVLVLIARGLSTQQIAETLARSSKTIDSHRSRLTRKLCARNRVELTRIAVAAGMVPAFAFGSSPGEGTRGEAREGEGEGPEREHALPADDVIGCLTGARMAFWTWNARTNVVRVSANFLANLGYDPAGFSTDSNTWRRVLHPDDLAWVDDRTRRALESNARAYELEYRMLRASGEVRLFRVTCTIERDGAGRAERVLGMSHDITDVRNQRSPLCGALVAVG